MSAIPLCRIDFPISRLICSKKKKSENVSKLFTPHPAKRFEPGDHYYLFVEFSSTEEAQNAMDTLNGQEGPWGANLRVQRARGETSNSQERRNKWSSARDSNGAPATDDIAVGV